MEAVPFVFADRATVPGFLGTDVQSEIVRHILELKADKLLIVTDAEVDRLHGDYLSPKAFVTDGYPGETGVGAQGLASSDAAGAQAQGLKSGLDAEIALPTMEKKVLPSGDAAKSWEHLTELVKWNFAVGATKKSVIVAFGGGALLNVAGLFASMAYRGTKLVYVPTTFLAMHDVVTSLKTSICFDGRKNNIGSFYAPAKILIDTAFCRTLPRMELFSGLGELAKNACLFGGKHAEGFMAALSKEAIDGANGGSGEEFSLNDETLLELTRLGIDAKMSVLLTDPLERTSGMIFEYGHTVSHAIEKAYGDGTIPHGLGVTYGMLSSSDAAERLGHMSKEDRLKHDELCNALLVKWPLPEPKPSVERVMELAMKDSKRGITSEGPGEISDVILCKMGDVLPTKTQMLYKFPAAWIAEWLVTMGFPSEDSGTPRPWSAPEEQPPAKRARAA